MSSGSTGTTSEEPEAASGPVEVSDTGASGIEENLETGETGQEAKEADEDREIVEKEAEKWMKQRKKQL